MPLVAPKKGAGGRRAPSLIAAEGWAAIGPNPHSVSAFGADGRRGHRQKKKKKKLGLDITREEEEEQEQGSRQRQAERQGRLPAGARELPAAARNMPASCR